MKWCRFQAGQKASFGLIEDDLVLEVTGSPFADHTVTDISYDLREVTLLPPVIPPMLYAAGPNYRGHVEGMARRRGAEPPQYPTRPEPNFRSVHALIGTEANIIVPKECSGAVQPEGQLAVVILHPGDVLWMGTEGADGDMVPGDVVEVEISGIGVLRNYVVAEE